MTTVVLADDQELVRTGLRAILEAEDDIHVVGEAVDGADAVAVVRRLTPDVVLMDIRMPVLDGIAAHPQDHGGRAHPSGDADDVPPFSAGLRLLGRRGQRVPAQGLCRAPSSSTASVPPQGARSCSPRAIPTRLASVRFNPSTLPLCHGQTGRMKLVLGADSSTRCSDAGACAVAPMRCR